MAPAPPSGEDGYMAVAAADFAIGEVRCLDVGGQGVLVARGQDGHYYAVQRQCSHAALDLNGARVRGSAIVCPHHGARFDLGSGRALGPPASAPIAAYATRVRDGMVQVRVGA